MYKYLLKPILFRFDPELVHNVFVSLGELLGRFLLTRTLTSAIYGYHGPEKKKIVDGITYRTPVLLSAGFDYNGRLSRILPSIGFGGEEIGSVTARPCAGNPKPRLTRLPKDRSLVVNKGLKNDGVEVIIARLKATPRVPGFVLGISLARTNDGKAADLEEGMKDYETSLRKLTEANIGDYYAINISCPNAFGGETFAVPDLAEQLLTRLDAVPCAKPIYVKMPINLAWPEFDALLKVIARHRIKGVVIGNLNKHYDDLKFREEAPTKYAGGLSGAPTFSLSNELIRRTRAAYGNRFTIFGVGGIFSPQDALEKMEAGADLVQLITGMIYEGPGLIKRLDAALARKA
ncbi:MAG TPA: quinone-dependent dihydroorotate dehydrogenase [Candidatus Paceibacterota bacterium]|nr:quinone-dependent dihydroorotate dehydrogenase [Candidatus Paceibacterota bacterium]